MTNVFRGCGAVFYKEVLHVRRDFATLFFSLIIPILQMTLLGYGIDTNIRQINTVVFNADGRRESRELIDRLKNSDTFHVMRHVQNDRDLNDMIVSGRARVGIKIPVDYSDRLLHQMSAQVLVLIDGSHSFPSPFIDWYYTAFRLRVGGFLVVDDTQLWTGHVLKRFLEAEPDWGAHANLGDTVVDGGVTWKNQGPGNCRGDVFIVELK